MAHCREELDAGHKFLGRCAACLVLEVRQGRSCWPGWILSCGLQGAMCGIPCRPVRGTVHAREMLARVQEACLGRTKPCRWSRDCRHASAPLDAPPLPMHSSTTCVALQLAKWKAVGTKRHPASTYNASQPSRHRDLDQHVVQESAVALDQKEQAGVKGSYWCRQQGWRWTTPPRPGSCAGHWSKSPQACGFGRLQSIWPTPRMRASCCLAQWSAVPR